MNPGSHWQRVGRRPMAERIARELPPDLLRLRTRALLGDVMRVHRCSRNTAATAIAMARRARA